MSALQFSYKKHYLSHIMRNSIELFPGATRIIAYYYDPILHGIKAIECDLENKIIEIKPLDFKKLKINDFDNFRKQRARFTWIDQELLIGSHSEDQLKISGEFKNHTLLLRFANQHDGNSDLLLIYFKNEESVFRMSGKPQKLSTELKHSLASVYVRNLDVIRKQIEQDASIDEIIRAHTQNKQNHENDLNKELSELRESQFTLIRSIANKMILRLLNIDEFHIEWKEEALIYLAKHFNDFDQIEKVLRKALIIALNETSNKDQISIEASHIITNDVIRQEEVNNQIAIRYQRTITMLDRYEEAASLLVKEQQSITGSNIGMNLQPPISAAAISDAIRKHASKISHLLNKNPERWSILRSHFKPIQNKLYIAPSAEQLAS